MGDLVGVGVTSVTNQTADDDINQCDQRDTKAHLFFMVVYTLVFVVGLVLNSLTLKVYFCSAQQQVSSIMMVYMRNLAASDFLLCVCLPLRIIKYISSSVTFHLVYCNFAVLGLYLNMYASILFMGYIAANRTSTNMGDLEGVDLTSVTNQTADDDINQCDQRDTKAHLFFIPVYTLVFVVGLVLNSLTLKVYFCSAQQQVSSIMMVYMRNLAASDFLLCLYLPLRIINYISSSVTFSVVYCNFAVFGLYLNMYASILFMGYIAANRASSNMGDLVGADLTSVTNQTADDDIIQCDLEDKTAYLFFMPVYTVVFVVGVVLNSLTLKVYFCSAKLQVSRIMMVYMKNLAASDFVLCLCLPFNIANYVSSSANFRQVYCIFVDSTFYLNTYASILFMGYIAANR
ncbi:uncharacterized protein LOC128360020 [Scomber scombrus]|uniref:Uncharacterized protein LOC128360020 n=1 Tax=Scomber scombrus TaxID=13677 RepID=A0AAV1Q9U3_SCOSC